MSDRDVWFQQRLVALGWTVTIIDDDVATSASASGRQLVVISESASQAGVNTKFTAVAVPLINQETFLSDELGMTTAANQGITSGSTQTQVTVTAAGAGHQLGGGFAAGNVTVASSGMDWGWNVPTTSALVAATMPGDSSKALVYAYQTGAVMASGTAPAPRVAWPHYAGSPTYLKANAVTLFNAMVGWATNTQIRYTRDSAGRITARSVNGTVTARYVYTGAGDSPALTLDPAGAVAEKTVSLPGGVLVTKRGNTSSDVWSYPNLHGDIVATTNGAGVKNGATKAYDPYGVPLGATTLPDNTVGEFDYSWHGQQRPLEHQPGLQPVIEMGARQYDPQTGRFLQTDPIEGGNNNDYTYPNEPNNTTDLNGQCGVFGNPWKKCTKQRKGQRGFLWGIATKALRSIRVGIDLPMTERASLWGVANGGSCSWNGTRWIVVCAGMRTGYGPRRGMTVGGVYLTGEIAPDSRLLRHEANHANQWAWMGGGPNFPIAYGIAELLSGGSTKNPFEIQAGLSDGCYIRRAGC